MNKKYIYIREDKKSNTNVISIGYVVNSNSLKFAIALCCNKDNFSKKIAKKIIDGRLEKGNCYTIDINSSFMQYKDCKKTIISTLKHDMFKLPNWAKLLIIK